MLSWPVSVEHFPTWCGTVYIFWQVTWGHLRSELARGTSENRFSARSANPAEAMRPDRLRWAPRPAGVFWKANRRWSSSPQPDLKPWSMWRTEVNAERTHLVAKPSAVVQNISFSLIPLTKTYKQHYNPPTFCMVTVKESALRFVYSRSSSGVLVWWSIICFTPGKLCSTATHRHTNTCQESNDEAQVSI